jgi:hypothetical protein|tara:strand:- start:640 stop:891 length:252 start_codon:yes stop_codon:yes gene_type:complete
MSYDKENPKKVESEFTAKASGELEEAVAEELEIEDPTVEEAAAVIEELTVEEEVEEEVVAEEAAPEPEPEVSEAPVRHRGPRN